MGTALIRVMQQCMSAFASECRDAQEPARYAWRRSGPLRLRLCICALVHVLCVVAAPSEASERYALVITGASGGPPYTEKYQGWRTALVDTLTTTFEYPSDHVIVLGEDAHDDVRPATREQVRQAIDSLKAKITKDDLLLVVLIGHGTGSDGDEAKFNLVGPDLSSAEWTALLRNVPGQLVFVDTSSGSYPFLAAIAGRNRVVITANDSPAQQFETIFPGFFVAALTSEAADLDKNGRVSVWEAFVTASDDVRRTYEEKGQLPTERALLDDTGRGTGIEAEGTGDDGIASRVVYFRAEPPIAGHESPARAALLRRRAELSAELDLARVRKPALSADEYETLLERILLEIARIDRQLRSPS